VCGESGHHRRQPACLQLVSAIRCAAAAATRSTFVLGIEYLSARKAFEHQLAEVANIRFRLAELSAATATTTASSAFTDAGFLRLAAQKFSDPRTALGGRTRLWRGR
jgi:hypothetical protein